MGAHANLAAVATGLDDARIPKDAAGREDVSGEELRFLRERALRVAIWAYASFGDWGKKKDGVLYGGKAMEERRLFCVFRTKQECLISGKMR